jgi:hypothetical protein
VDQWSLVHTGLAAICFTKEHPAIWENSFIAVNLHPNPVYRLSFEDWCKKIEPHMQAADSFDLTTHNKVDEYLLLPAMWQAMSSEDKKKAVHIYTKHGAWSPECLVEFKDEFAVTMKEVSAFQVCVWLAIDNPDHLDRGMEDVEIEEDGEVAMVENNRGKAMDGLSMWKLKPPSMEGEKLFDHDIGYRCREYA